ncbi:MAG: hypothetical protein ABIY55_14430 [Kofleriaceae bacterium]
MTVDLAIRPFLRRILGYSDASTIAVDRAERSLQLAASRYATLVLCGEGDLVPIAAALHRRTLGPNAPFIVCDPRRRSAAATVRSPANRGTAAEALTAATGGTICLRTRRLPRDLASVIERIRDPEAHLHAIVCWGVRDDTNPLLIVPAPIVLPTLCDRAHELPKIIDEYALDAMAELLAPVHAFTSEDRTWVIEHAAGSLDRIEKATRRRVALRSSRNLSTAATRLDMAPVSLARWVERRSRSAS